VEAPREAKYVESEEIHPDEYEKPQVTDYGDLRKLTATGGPGSHLDVPKGTPVPPFSVFS
jgi:hypothetical protein